MVRSLEFKKPGTTFHLNLPWKKTFRPQRRHNSKENRFNTYVFTRGNKDCAEEISGYGLIWIHHNENMVYKVEDDSDHGFVFPFPWSLGSLVSPGKIIQSSLQRKLWDEDDSESACLSFHFQGTYIGRLFSFMENRFLDWCDLWWGWSLVVQHFSCLFQLVRGSCVAFTICLFDWCVAFLGVI